MESAKNQFVVFDISSCPSTQHHLHKTAKRKKNISSEQHIWRCTVQLQLRHKQHINKVLEASEALTSWAFSAH